MGLVADKNASSYVVTSLGEIGDEQAVTPLRELLQDNGFPRKDLIVDALGKIPGPRAAMACVGLLKDDRTKDPSRIVFYVIQMTLHQDPRAIDSVIAALQDKDASMRESAAGALRFSCRDDAKVRAALAEYEKQKSAQPSSQPKPEPAEIF
jgi:HEAT repeat protein